jgi:FtsZ-binding cell division protein ZapB
MLGKRARQDEISELLLMTIEARVSGLESENSRLQDETKKLKEENKKLREENERLKKQLQTGVKKEPSLSKQSNRVVICIDDDGITEEFLPPPTRMEIEPARPVISQTSKAPPPPTGTAAKSKRSNTTHSNSHSNQSMDDDDDIVITGAIGDSLHYPHPRNACKTYPFRQTSNIENPVAENKLFCEVRKKIFFSKRSLFFPFILSSFF